MARKSRKYRHVAFDQTLNLNTVGYIRLSVSDTNESHSIENQRLIIEQPQIPIAHYYVDDGHSGTSFNRPAFREMTQDIRSGKIGCVVVKDLSRLLESMLEEVVAQKTTYEKQYQMFRKLMCVRDKELPLSEIMDLIDKIVIDAGKQITVEWRIFKDVENYKEINQTV